MENWIDLDTFDVKRFAESLARDGQEAVKWEIRKLQWILEEERKAAESKSDAA